MFTSHSEHEATDLSPRRDYKFMGEIEDENGLKSPLSFAPYVYSER